MRLVYLRRIPRHRGGGEVCFWPPLLWPRTFVKSTEDFFKKKARRRRKIFGVPFFKNYTVFENVKKLTVFSGFNGFLTIFSGFQCLHNEKKPGAGEKFGNPFFCAPKARQNFPRTFSFSSEGPPKKIWWRRMPELSQFHNSFQKYADFQNSWDELRKHSNFGCNINLDLWWITSLIA